MEFLSVSGGGMNTNLRAGETWQVSPDTLRETAGTIFWEFIQFWGIFEIFASNHLHLLIK